MKLRNRLLSTNSGEFSPYSTVMRCAIRWQRSSSASGVMAAAPRLQQQRDRQVVPLEGLDGRLREHRQADRLERGRRRPLPFAAIRVALQEIRAAANVSSSESATAAICASSQRRNSSAEMYGYTRHTSR